MLLATSATTPSCCTRARSSIFLGPLLARALVVAAKQPPRRLPSPLLSSPFCSRRRAPLSPTMAAEDDLDALYGAAADSEQEKKQTQAAPAPPPAAAPAAPPPRNNLNTRPPPTLLRPSSPLPADLRAAFSNAVVLIDKPPGWSSFDVCHALKRPLKALGIAKVGHAGTLDPMATGLLVVCTGQATKSIESFMGRDKAYTATLRLGQATPSQDAETAVCEEDEAWQGVTDEALRKLAQERLTGDHVMQRPPIYSALHAGGGTGKRLYELAREGGEAAKRAEEARPARAVRVASFVLEPRPEKGSLSAEECERLDREQAEAAAVRAEAAAEAEASDAERRAERERRGGGRTPSPLTSEEQEEQQQKDAAPATAAPIVASGRVRRRDRAERLPSIPYDPRRDVRFECIVSKGTYVRTLGADLAELAGTKGHLTALRRTAVGDDLRVEDSWDVRDLVSKMREGLKAMGVEEKEPQMRVGNGRGRRRGKGPARGGGGGGGGGDGNKRARVAEAEGAAAS